MRRGALELEFGQDVTLRRLLTEEEEGGGNEAPDDRARHLLRDLGQPSHAGGVDRGGDG